MNIKVEILESETTVASPGAAAIKKPKSSKTKKDDGKLIGMYENYNGMLFGLIVLPDGSIKKVQSDLIKVIDNQYL